MGDFFHSKFFYMHDLEKFQGQISPTGKKIFNGVKGTTNLDLLYKLRHGTPEALEAFPLIIFDSVQDAIDKIKFNPLIFFFDEMSSVEYSLAYENTMLRVDMTFVDEAQQQRFIDTFDYAWGSPEDDPLHKEFADGVHVAQHLNKWNRNS